MKSTYRMTVLGRELQVRSSASPEQVREIEEFVNSRIRTVEPLVRGGDTLMVAALTLLNMAEEHISLAAGADSGDGSSSERIERLIHLLDSVQ